MTVFKMICETVFPLESFATVGNRTLILRRTVSMLFVSLSLIFILESFPTAGITALIRSSTH